MAPLQLPCNRNPATGTPDVISARASYMESVVRPRKYSDLFVNIDATVRTEAYS